MAKFRKQVNFLKIFCLRVNLEDLIVYKLIKINNRKVLCVIDKKY